MASVIDIIIQAQDRASQQFRNTSAEARKMQALIATVGTVGSAGMMVLAGAVGATASLFGTAGLAVAGFGALAFTTIGKTIEKANALEEAELKANAALIAGDTKGYAKQMALVQAIMESMTAEEQKAVVAINQLSDAWRDMENKMMPTTLNLVAASTDFLRLTMTKLFPSFQGVGQSFAGMIQKMNDGITSGKADKFFEHMNTFAVPMFEQVMKSAGNILVGLGNIMIAFTPLGMQLGDGMVGLTDKFAKWTAGLQSSTAFQDFVTFVQTNTPIVTEFIGTLWNTITNLVIGLAPLGIAVLEVATEMMNWANEIGLTEAALNLAKDAAKFMSDNAEELGAVIGTLLVAFAAWKVALGIASLIQTVVTVVKTMTTVIKACRSAMLLLNIAMLANPMVWVTALIVALIAVGILLWQNWDEIKKYADQLWKKIKDAWNNMSKAVEEGYDKMVASVKKWWSDTKQKWDDMVTSTKAKAEEMKQKAVAAYENLKREAVQKVVGLYNDARDKWNQIKSDAQEKVNSMKTAVVNKFNELKSSAVEKLQTLLSDTKQKFNDMVQAAKDKISSFKQAGVDMLARFKDAVVEGFNKSMDSVYKGVNNMVKQVKEFLSTFKNAGKGLLDAFTDGVKSGINKAKNAVSDGMNAIRQYLPFSPAKKGPLSDLDKSGEAFFPTWYEAALTQVSKMQRVVGGAFQGVAKEANVALAGTGLEAFTGGRTKVTVHHTHEPIQVKGTVDIDGEVLKGNITELAQREARESVSDGGFDTRSMIQTIRSF